MKLAYRAFEKAGREITDVIEAPSVQEATDRLRQQELFIADIAPVQEARTAPPARRTRLPRGRTGRMKDLALFTRQLYVLIRAGTPLADGLYALQRQARDERWRSVVQDVRLRVEQGMPLAKALESRPEYFDRLYCNMIAAGETSGKLTVVLERLADLIRKRLQTRRTVRGAMVYPALLVVVTGAVFVLLLLLVIPRFAMLFASLDVPLPPTTAGLIALSGWLRSYWPVPLGAVLAAAGGVRWLLRSPAGRQALDNFALRLPLVGGLVRSFMGAQIARLLGVLLDSHLPMLEALGLTRNTLSCARYAELLGAAEEAVSRGRPISSAFQDSDLISPSLYEVMHSGEQSGQMSLLLLDLAEFMDQDNEAGLKSLVSLLEPCILILMGVVVGFVALSIFTPLFDATSLVQGAHH
jgi:type II secretory pathway component PulF